LPSLEEFLNWKNVSECHYGLAYSFAEYIVESYGFSEFLELLKLDYSDNASFERLLKFCEEWVLNVNWNFKIEGDTKMIEKTLNRKDIFQGKIIDLHVDEVLLSNGEKSVREVVEHKKNVACISALTPENEVVFVRQFRYPFKEIF